MPRRFDLFEWSQHDFTTPGVLVQSKPGDYYELSNLKPSDDRRRLVRIPAWSSQVVTDTNGLTEVQGLFYDHANSRVVCVGGDSVTSNLTSAYLDSSWSLSAETELHATPTNLGGLSMRNCVWWAGYLWLIGSDAKVYRGTAYTAGLAEFDGSNDHEILVPIDENLYAVKTGGKLDRTSGDNLSLTGFDVPKNALDIQYFIGFRSYALAIARAASGGWDFYRVDLDVTSGRFFNQVTSFPVGGVHPSYGCLFTLHEDDVFFSPGYHTRPGSENVLDVYRFTGSRVEYVAEIRHAPNTGGSGVPTSAGFISWRGELLYYALEGTSQIFKILKGGHFLDFATLSATAPTVPLAANCGGYLVATSGGGNEGINYLTDATLSDAYLVTSWLDMGHPGRLKRLVRVTAVLSEAASDFKIKLQYRTDDNTSWTTASTENNTRVAQNDPSTAVTFYTIQLKIELDDDTGNNEDISIEAVSLVYSMEA